MTGEWYNNRIGKKLYEEFPRDFSVCDVDGLVRFEYYKNNSHYTRLIIYESKNEDERPMKSAQYKSLKMIDEAINWHMFDYLSGLFVLKIRDIDKSIFWYTMDRELVRETTFQELYNIFSGKDIR